jgi:ATP-binding cassette subfamily A (ABC1) protein 1
MSDIRAMTGVCPQYNILFDDLTCEEHLMFYGNLRGLSNERIRDEVTENRACTALM